MGTWCNCIECVGDQPEPTDEELAAEKRARTCEDGCNGCDECTDYGDDWDEVRKTPNAAMSGGTPSAR